MRGEVISVLSLEGRIVRRGGKLRQTKLILFTLGSSICYRRHIRRSVTLSFSYFSSKIISL